MSDEVEQYLAKLRRYLESETLDFEGRFFILREIWDLRITAQENSRLLGKGDH